MIDPPRIPASLFPRNRDQRAAFGGFFMNLSGGRWPGSVTQRQTAQFQYTFFQRDYGGFPGPIFTLLAEQKPASSHAGLDVIAKAVLSDLPECRAVPIIRIFVAAAGIGPIVAPDPYRAAFIADEEPCAIEFKADFEPFLQSLGKHTRRQIRQLQRKAIKFGQSFAFGTVNRQHLGARFELGRHAGPARYGRRQITAYENFLAAQDGSYAAGLYSNQGALLSYSSGLLSDGAAILRYQMNDRRHLKAALSLSLRGHLCEALIKAGVQELIVPGGVAGVLQHACRHRASGELILLRQSLGTALVLGAARLLRRESSLLAAAGNVKKSAGKTITEIEA